MRNHIGNHRIEFYTVDSNDTFIVTQTYSVAILYAAIHRNMVNHVETFCSKRNSIHDAASKIIPVSKHKPYLGL